MPQISGSRKRGFRSWHRFFTSFFVAELLAPAGTWDCLRAAIANGADAVYFGLPRFNARLRAENFQTEELPDVVRFCHDRGVKAYVAFNTLVFTSELADAEAQLRACSRAGVDALIVQDLGLAWLSRTVTPDLPIHGSTQMTIASPEGVDFVARELSIPRVVLARETSLRELQKFQTSTTGAELEVFVHGALCVAYSGQCLTSESLGQRSANRGECAQACRLPYELIVDGVVRDLGDQRYLLSPQDLAAVREIPELIAHGVASFKIEGRLKSPEYVAAVTQVYRKAIDAALANRPNHINAADEYRLEMTFSRGLFSGWMHGVDHQKLVPARFSGKRGPLLGTLENVGRDYVEFRAKSVIAPGDGVVFGTNRPDDKAQGGRVFRIEQRRVYFGRGQIDFHKLRPGLEVWKTNDPALEKTLRSSFAGKIEPRQRTPLDLVVEGSAGHPLVLSCPAHGVSASSTIPLQEARTAPLNESGLRDHFGRMSETPFALGTLENQLTGHVMLPIAELNRVRRAFLSALAAKCTPVRSESSKPWRTVWSEVMQDAPARPVAAAPHLSVLCRDLPQIRAALACGIQTILCDFEDVRRYADAVQLVRQPGDLWTSSHSQPAVFLATPRIHKAGEAGFLRIIPAAEPDGILIRNLAALEFFADSPLRKRGDFSLNVANPFTAAFLHRFGLETLTISYDLDIAQVLDLLEIAPPEWFELTLHQHIPMFHMEHCVFAAFMSKGSSYLDCGRPCEKHRVHLRDRVGMQHPLRADAGCRNTLFNAVAQTGASYYQQMRDTGLAAYRVELLEEDEAAALRTITAYQDLLAGRRDGESLWRDLKAMSQLGVTRGTLGEARARS